MRYVHWRPTLENQSSGRESVLSEAGIERSEKMSDEAFARDVLKIAVAAACHQMEFTNIESSALEVLIDLVQVCM